MSTTYLNISFDTEDFTSNYAADAIIGTATLLHQEGVRADYNIVGLLARQLIAWKRWDVLEALSHHEISFHSRGHSFHPTLVEYGDLEDAAAAYDRTLREEVEGMGMVRAVTGADRLAAACSPGTNYSYLAQYVYAENGIDGYTGSTIYLPDGSPIWMCGLRHFEYIKDFESMVLDEGFDLEAFVESLSQRKVAVVFNHPHMINFTVHWDKYNYYGENTYEWGQWHEPPRRDEATIARFYETMRRFVRLAKAAKNPDGSPKFIFKTISEITDAEKKPRIVRRTDVPLYLAALKKALAEDNFHLLTLSDAGTTPVSLSECLCAAAGFLSGADEVDLTRRILRGFLSAPTGVAAPTTLTRTDVAASLAAIDFSSFLPASIPCGDSNLGPLDLLMAALALIADPAADAVTVTPNPQTPSLDLIPTLRDQYLPGTWLFAEDFRDTYMSNRLRLQAWTAHR